MTILEFLTGSPPADDRVPDDAPKVDISSSGQMSVDFARVMETQRYRDDLAAIRKIAARAGRKS